MDTKILIITDDRDTKHMLVQSLVRTKAWTLAIPTEPGALPSYLIQADLVILDIPQADLQEFSLLKQIREVSTVPIIGLVASEDYRIGIGGLDRGADHVMVKPVDEQELRARVRALLRRVQAVREKSGGPWGAGPTSVREAGPAEASPSNTLLM